MYNVNIAVKVCKLSKKRASSFLGDARGIGYIECGVPQLSQRMVAMAWRLLA